MNNNTDIREFADEWMQIAERDLERARKRCEEGDWEDAGFRIQQSVEKFLKGYLAKHGVPICFTHDLDDLLDEVSEIDQDFEEFREACRLITAYYMWDRYPRIQEEPLAESEVHESLLWAERIADKVKSG